MPKAPVRQGFWLVSISVNFQSKSQVIAINFAIDRNVEATNLAVIESNIYPQIHNN